MHVNNELVARLIQRNITPAIHYFEQTKDSSRLEHQINFCVQQIIVCLNSDTVATIKALLQHLIAKSQHSSEHSGWRKAFELFNNKYKV